jgi:hypothetical protein
MSQDEVLILKEVAALPKIAAWRKLWKPAEQQGGEE